MSISSMTGLALARAIRDKALSSEEVTRHFLDQLERHNPRLQAFVSHARRRALLKARLYDNQLVRGLVQRERILFGVPCGVKDLDPLRGRFTRMGAPGFGLLWTPVDGPVGRRVRQGGVVFLGKLATSELGLMPITETEVHPPCRNPWNPDHTPGGSSGGSASAVAAGMLPLAQGSDGAGSIRIPAAFCHLVGHKPSRGFFPHALKAIDPAWLTAFGALTLDVEDTAAMLDAMLGRRYDPRHPTPDSLVSICQTLPPPLKIGMSVYSPLGPVDPRIADGITEVARTLEALGHHVEDGLRIEGELDEFLPIYTKMMATLPAPFESRLQAPTRWMREMGRDVSKQDVLDAAEQMNAKVEARLSAYDVVLTPTVAVPPPRVGAWRDMDGESAFRWAAQLGAFTAPFNVSGQPAISVPVGVLEEDNLPFGAQLVGRHGADGLVLRLAKQLEEARPWLHRRAEMRSAD